MIKHIVLLEFNSQLSAQKIESIFTLLKNLKQTIPEILDFSWGYYQSNEGLNKNYTHGFIMKFNSEKARDKYLEHPDHINFAQNILLPALQNGLDSVVVFDYSEKF